QRCQGAGTPAGPVGADAGELPGDGYGDLPWALHRVGGRLEFEEVADLLLSMLFVTPVPVEAARLPVWDLASEPYDLSRHPHPQLVRQMAGNDVDHAVEQLTLLGGVLTRPPAEAL